MKTYMKIISCAIATLAALFLIACPGGSAGGGDETMRTFTFDSGGAYHIQNLGAWRATLTGDGILSLSHDTAGDITDYGDFTLTDEEAARLWDAVAALDIPGMNPDDRPGVPDEVQYTFILEDEGETFEVLVWINDAREMPGVDEFLTVLVEIIEKYTGEKPALR